MKVLALELSSARGSIAFRDGEQNLFAEEFANDRKHSGIFFEQLDRCMRACGPADRIAVGLGPGSYAGTRIAIAAAIGLQAITGSELLGLPSPCAMPTTSSEYVVIGDARRQSFYYARVLQRRCLEGPELHTEQELAEKLRDLRLPLFSSEPLASFPEAAIMFPSASVLAELALEETVPASGSPLEPIYLRDPHITQPKTSR